MAVFKKVVFITGISLLVIGLAGTCIFFVWGMVKTLVLAWSNVMDWAGLWGILLYVFFLPLLIIIIPWYELMIRHNPYPLLILYIYPVMSISVLILGASLQKMAGNYREPYER